MDKTPNSMRLHIGIFGCMNVGKSSLFNSLIGEETSIVSSVKGTTTDSVKKAYEIDKVGSVLFIDTAGIDDESNLGKQRVTKTMNEIDRIDIAIVVLKNQCLNNHELNLINKFEILSTPILFVINKNKDEKTSNDLLQHLNKFSKNIVTLNLIDDKVDEIYTKIYDIFNLKFEEKNFSMEYCQKMSSLY